MSFISRRKLIQAVGGGVMASTGLGENAVIAQTTSIPPEPRFLEWYSHKYCFFPGEVVEIRSSIKDVFGSMPISMNGPFDFEWKLVNLLTDDVIKTGSATLFQRYPLKSASEDQGWPVVIQCQLPSDLAPGVYVIQPINGGAPRCPVYVRRRHTQPKPELLVVIPSNTANAYATAGGQSTYSFTSPYTKPANVVSFRRPTNPLDIGWAALFSWLEERFTVDYVTDFEMHMEPGLLDGYKCVVFIDHNEYYTRETYSHIMRYQKRGGNIANLAGNTCWYVVQYIDDNTAFHCKQGVNQYFHYIGRSGRFIFGNRYEGVGAVTRNPEAATVYNAHHWIYNHTGLVNGAKIGETEAVAAYEVDGIDIKWVNGHPLPVESQGLDPSYTILAVSQLRKSFPSNTKLNWTVGIFDTPNGGQVFNAAAILWFKAFQKDHVAASPLPVMTRNYLHAVLNCQLIEFKSIDPTVKSARNPAGKGYMYMYLKHEEISVLPKRRENGLLIVRKNGIDWTETQSRLTFPISSRAGVLPLYKHYIMLRVPGEGKPVYKEILSPSSVSPHGWLNSGVYVYGFASGGDDRSELFEVSDNRVPGVSVRLSCRLDSKVPEVVRRASYFVY